MKITKSDITLSNGLSLLRLLLAIPFWLLLNNFQDQESRTYLILIGVVVVFTDWADGYFARKFNQITELGKLIDPLADKVCAGILITKLYLIGEITPVLFFILIGRDVLIFIAGIFLTKYLGKILPSNFLGKVTVTFIALFIFMICFGFNKEGFAYLFIYYLIILLSFLSLIAYAIRAAEFIKKRKNGFI
ncbi:MAG: CDP-alcohol phosphatidyltransferase family protein [Ignavibacteria bacterium]|nr:CDP-alcohol phosphatidyltransferase family protein [Ignavibacteria bacterium]